MNSFLLRTNTIRNINKINRFLLIKKNNKLFNIKNINKPIYVTRSINNIDAIGETSYYILKSGLLYVFFYCSLQWFHYKNLRENDDDDEK